MSYLVSTDGCRWDKRDGTMQTSFGDIGCDRFPDVVEVTSTHTGRTVKFKYDVEAALENEFWDGEMAKYRPLDADVKVTSLTVYPYEAIPF